MTDKKKYVNKQMTEKKINKNKENVRIKYFKIWKRKEKKKSEKILSIKYIYIFSFFLRMRIIFKRINCRK